METVVDAAASCFSREHLTMAATSSSIATKRICGHCNRDFSKTLYFQHKKKYEWKKRTMKGVEEFTFSSDGKLLSAGLIC